MKKDSADHGDPDWGEDEFPDLVKPSGRSRFWKQVVLVVGFIALCGWAVLHLYDHYHPAAPAARGLWNPQASSRLAAVHDLERFGRDDTGTAIPALIKGLRDSDAEVRAAAAVALVSVTPGVAGAPEPKKEDVRDAVTALLKALKDPQPIVRAAAAQSIWMVVLIGRLPEEEIDLKAMANTFLEQLRDPDPSVRLAAIRGLGMVGPKVWDDPPAALVAALESESERERDEAGGALPSFRRGFPPLIPTLVRSLEQASPQSRAGFLKALGQVRPPAFSADAVTDLIAALGSRDGEIVAAAVADLVVFKDKARPAVPALVAALNHWIESKPIAPATSDLVVALVEALGGLAPGTPSNDEAVAALAKVSRVGETRQRIAAAKALGGKRFTSNQFRRDPALFSALTSMINDRDPRIRIAAFWAIDEADFKSPFIVPKALAAALEEDSAEIREGAAAAIGHSGIGVDPFIPALFRHAEHDPDSEVRAVCYAVLNVTIRPPKVTSAAVPDLLSALGSPDAKIRVLAARILSTLGPDATSAVPALVQLLKEPASQDVWNVNAEAAEALGQIAPGTPQADQAVTALMESLLSKSDNPYAAIRALPGFGPKARGAIPRLRALQEHPSARIQEAATKALARLEAVR
jgi:HEAT repeat protein